MSRGGYRCFECPKTSPKIGEAETSIGWGKFQGRMGMGRGKISITVVHCPDHKKGFVSEIARQLGDVLEDRLS